MKKDILKALGETLAKIEKCASISVRCGACGREEDVWLIPAVHITHIKTILKQAEKKEDKE